MIRKPVSSSNLRSVGYDSESRILEVEFQGGGIYQYFDVPESTYDALMSAPSHGSYFHRHVRNRYQYRKMQ
ncbi:MAG: KTSC domain-containing protein [Theionarchaea archaeon]|nr:KTSC domain-containing protein [Theionarchaea archaeon]